MEIYTVGIRTVGTQITQWAQVTQWAQITQWAQALLDGMGDRLYQAATTFPTVQAGWIWLGLAGVYGAIALPIGFWTGLFCWERVKKTQTITTAILTALFFPAVVEEIIFRVWLLPNPHSPISGSNLTIWAIVSLAIFIISHPLNARFVLRSRRETFYNPSFLSLAGLLGLACTVTYWQSASLWPPVLLHWLLVVIWLLFLGGERRMAGQIPPDHAKTHHSKTQN